MRRFKAVLLCAVLLVCAVGVSGCGKDEWVEVCGVSYVDMQYNTKVNLSSMAQIKLKENRVEITLTEYEAMDFKTSKLLYEIKSDRSNLPKINSLIGYSDSFFNKYYKSEVSEIDLKMVSIQIIDSNSVVIKDHTGKKIHLLGQQCEIRYFN